MTKIYALILVLTLCNEGLYAQSAACDSMIAKANQFYNENDYIRSLEYAQKAIELASTPKQKADAHMQAGRNLKQRKAFDDAMRHYYIALNIRKNILYDPQATARTLTTISAAALDMENDTLAYFSAYTAVQTLKGLHTPEADSILPMACNNLANAYEQLDSLEKAVSTNLEGLKAFETTRDTSTKIIGEYGLAKRLMTMQDFSEAGKHLDIAFDFSRNQQSPDTALLVLIYELKGVLAMRSQKAEQAIEYFETAKRLCLKEDLPQVQLAHLCFNLGEAYEAEDRLLEAVKAYECAEQNSKKGSEDAFSIAHFAQTRLETVGLAIQKAKYSRWIFLSLIGLCLALIALLAVLFLNYKREKIQALTNERLLIKERENSSLKDEMTKLRHDIVKNFLETINGLISTANRQKNDETFRQIRYLTNKVLIQIGYARIVRDEALTLKAFAEDMYIQAGIVSMRAVVNNSDYDDLPDIPLSREIRDQLSAIVMEAFTNIRKYAFDENDVQGKAEIRFEYNYEQGLLLKIRDYGKGFELNKVGRSGLKNMEDRARAIGASLVIISEPGQGTSIEIHLPH